MVISLHFPYASNLAFVNGLRPVIVAGGSQEPGEVRSLTPLDSLWSALIGLPPDLGLRTFHLEA